MAKVDVAIIGDGFCSLMTAHGLMAAGKSVLVIGRNDDWGPGIAYGRCADFHLLNVPAARMGSHPDAPEAFLKWAQDNHAPQFLSRFATSGRPLERAFLPRNLYGEYLRGIAKDVRSKVDYVVADCSDIDFNDDVFTVTAGNKTYTADRVVLAAGVPPTLDAPPGSSMTNPWASQFEKLSGSTEMVAILGTGLTMIDTVISLVENNFKGKIIALSRRGLLPEVHADTDDAPKVKEIETTLAPLTGKLSQKLKAFRRNIDLCVQKNIPWQAYFDYVRPDIPALWQDLTLQEQKRFLKRLLPFWNIHRHRQPAQTAELLKSLEREGRLEIRKGSRAPDDCVEVFNCRSADYTLGNNKLMQYLLAKGLITLHENGFGLAVDNALSARGRAQGRLYVAGSLTVGTFFESTAIPDLRAQCAKITKILG